jgi:hypothetical protein
MRGLVAVAVAVLAATSAQAARPPSLRFANLAPLVVQGQQFPRLARVSVTVTTGGRKVQRLVRSSTAGAFTTRFGDIVVSRCRAVLVRAATRNGAAATLKRPPLPGCMPERAP